MCIHNYDPRTEIYVTDLFHDGLSIIGQINDQLVLLKVIYYKQSKLFILISLFRGQIDRSDIHKGHRFRGIFCLFWNYYPQLAV